MYLCLLQFANKFYNLNITYMIYLFLNITYFNKSYYTIIVVNDNVMAIFSCKPQNKKN